MAWVNGDCALLLTHIILELDSFMMAKLSASGKQHNNKNNKNAWHGRLRRKGMSRLICFKYKKTLVSNVPMVEK